MKELWVKLKGVPSHLINCLVKYRMHVYNGCLIFILCGLFMFLREIEHGKQLIKLQKEKALIMMHMKKVKQDSDLLLKDADSQMGEAMGILTKQGMLLNKQGYELEQIKSALYIKTLFYNALVEYMKKIGEWPPKIPPPIDPSKMAESI